MTDKQQDHLARRRTSGREFLYDSTVADLRWSGRYKSNFLNFICECNSKGITHAILYIGLITL